MLKASILTVVFSLLFMFTCPSQDSKMQIGVIGLTHTHVHWIFGSEARGDFEIVGNRRTQQGIGPTLC